MVIATARVVLHIPSSHSLKDKRQVVRSLLSQVQRQFSLSAAETDDQDRWQVAVIGIAVVSGESAHAEEVVAKAVNFLAGRNPEAQLLDYQTELLHVW
ncbi:MAG TPA: DUF503 domain-containing protein [Chloroflexota bacterium]|nr:DUF503 domain-containing protein [Chloroflexota bacterium]